MAKIIAIGGGDVREKTTLSIDKEIINFSEKEKPRLLFIPTASSDSESYYAGIQSYFGSLGCTTDVLYLIRDRPSKKAIEQKILGADIIYVGGGNTLKMMTLWRKLGVDVLLRKALEKDIVLTGLSAGAICWFMYGNSDSRSFTSNSCQLIKVTGLGFLNGLCCPHWDSEMHRQKDLPRMMKSIQGVAIALEDDCALQIKDNSYRIITSQKDKKAYKIFWKRGKLYQIVIDQRESFVALDDLFVK